MSKDEPNKLARDAMAKAAEEYEKLAAGAEAEADLWRQAAEHLKQGSMFEAYQYREQANKLKEERNPRHGDRAMKFIEVADPEYFKGWVDYAVNKSIRQLTMAEVQFLKAWHDVTHGKDNCPTYRLLTEREAELKQ